MNDYCNCGETNQPNKRSTSCYYCGRELEKLMEVFDDVPMQEQLQLVEVETTDKDTVLYPYHIGAWEDTDDNFGNV